MQRVMEGHMDGRPLDREKLRAAIRNMGGDYIFFMLDDAITILPEAKLRNLVENYLNAAAFYADGTRKQNLLADAIAFQKASLSGSYYNGSAGRGKNSDEDPIETLSWIADCRRLLDRCAKQT